jgi:hypothetical protein
MYRGYSPQFFCAREDLELLFSDVETGCKLVYAEAGVFQEPAVRTFSSGAALPNLGTALSGATHDEPTYLVALAGYSFRVQSILRREGGTLHAVDQMWNPAAMALKLGGVYESGCLIAGELNTNFETESIRVYVRFSEHLREQCHRVRAFWVGQQAMQLWDSGYRLTIGIHASKALDLKR